MSWYVKGSFVLDRIFGTDLAKDIDISFDGEKPSESEVANALKAHDKPVEFQGRGFNEKLNIDALVLMPDGKVCDMHAEKEVATLNTIYAIDQLSSDDCMRALKTGYKYRHFLVLTPDLRRTIIQTIKQDADEGYFDIIERALTQYMTQDEVYMAIRNFLVEECQQALSEEDFPVFSDFKSVRIPASGTS